MKSILFFLIFCSVFCKGQDNIDVIESKSDTLRKVTQYAVFPGCEKHLGDNNKLYSCFAEQLRYSFESKSHSLENKYKSKNQNQKSQKKISASINFLFSKTGKMEVLGLREGSDEELGKDASAILNVLFESIIVEPARFADGTPVGLTLHIPVTIIF